MDNLPVDEDGVPMAGPMRDYVNKAVAAAIRANLDNLAAGGIPDLRGDKERAIAAKRQAIAEWNAMDRPPDPV